MTHVTFVSYDDVPPLGGQGWMLDELRRELRARGVTVSTVSGRGQNAVRFPRRTGRRPLDFSLYVNRHPELITRLTPDIVHIFGGPGGVLFTRAIRIPIVYHAHHTYRQAHGRISAKRALSIVETRAYRRAARVLAVSQSTADAVAAMGVPARRIEVLPPGIAIDESTTAAHEPGRILFAGRLEAEKGVLDALSVMERLIETRSDVSACVIGSGRLANVVRTRAAGGGIEYLGAVDEQTLHREYARASLLLMPSRYEGLGRTALEAQAAGTPVVGYDVTGLRDAVRDSGVLVRAGDPAALEAACVALLDEPDRRARLGERARSFVRRTHSQAAATARLEAIYLEVVAGSQARYPTGRGGRE